MLLIHFFAHYFMCDVYLDHQIHFNFTLISREDQIYCAFYQKKTKTEKI